MVHEYSLKYRSDKISIVEQDGKLESYKVIGCLKFLRLVDAELKPQLGKPLEALDVSSKEIGHFRYFLKKVVESLKGNWHPPLEGKELCHCRMVEASEVEEAILAGDGNETKVGKRTMAGTGCGTCRPDIQSMIRYVLD
jgi:bacterioferritin-associated ferredoxin